MFTAIHSAEQTAIMDTIYEAMHTALSVSSCGAIFTAVHAVK